MKKLFLQLSLIMLCFSCANNNEKKAVLSVNGTCDMCKATIEKSLEVDGIYEVNWDKKTKELKVSYDSILISLPTISTYISKAGYDNELVKASEDAYNNLHECCKYDRE